MRSLSALCLRSQHQSHNDTRKLNRMPAPVPTVAQSASPRAVRNRPGSRTSTLAFCWSSISMFETRSSCNLRATHARQKSFVRMPADELRFFHLVRSTPHKSADPWRFSSNNLLTLFARPYRPFWPQCDSLCREPSPISPGIPPRILIFNLPNHT